MVIKCTAVCLVALALLGSVCNAQRYPSQRQDTKQGNQDTQQTRTPFEKPLTWMYPEEPQAEPKPDVPFELRHPVPAATVAVDCREKNTHVEVKKDLFGIGQFINPDDLTLGNCGHVGEDSVAQVLIYESELHDCNSRLQMTDDSLIYTFSLQYNPKPLGDSPVVRTTNAAVIVECHYPRHHNVSSLPLDPHWVPFSSVKVAEEFLYFSLTLMTSDWMNERPRYEYYLGDMIFVEATVKQYYHVPLRVYVDNCVATLTPEINSSPRYAFIENGCLIDAWITRSDSKFMPRTEENKLRFMLEAFRFQGAESGLLYMTCYMRATSTSRSIDSDHRACSFINGWKEASGVDAACNSCDAGGYGSSGQGVVNSGGNAGWNPGKTDGQQVGGSWGTGGGGSSGSGKQVGGSWNPGGGKQVGGSWNPGGKQVGGSWTTGGGSGGKQIGSTWVTGGGSRKGRSLTDEETVWKGAVTLGPIAIGEQQ
ncbi:zona pellucida sperm-binding protein 3-like [Dunckerocampus dactyliophorus]|uniref:zona pellucida sperm-binding protein 3-like n=1 Tax=Dunckerocampus dactyliophorus TaxID=161453 RepID=UPI0024050F6C|nr:zona pellucida sperm-binding protein 3-like [Dunckerocampus dactyliophorus]